jgi:iron complex outermembrane receptor protein
MIQQFPSLLSRILATGLLMLCTMAAAQEPASQSAPAEDGFLDELLTESSPPPSDEPQAPAGDAQQPEGEDSPAEELDVIPVATREPPTQTLTEPGQAPAQLEEIVVTATKRAAPVRDIPATIAVLSGEDLEREGIQSVDQIVTLVPGVNLTDEGSGGQAKRITIRGVSTGLGVNPTAGTLFGDIPFSDPFLPKVQLDPNPFDMATVEVLKGPQGTLFGGTGLNGLIRYVPEAANVNAFQLKYFGQFNAYPGNGGDGWSTGAAVNVPFADHTAAVRVMGFHRDSPGYTDDRYNDTADINTLEQYGIRGMGTWMPTDRWTLSLTVATQHTTEADIPYTDNYDGDLSHGDSPRPSPSESRYTLASLGIERGFQWGDLISQTSYFEKQFDIFLEASRAVSGPLPLLAGSNASRTHGMTQELRAVSALGDSPWKWLAGAFYYQTDLYDCSDIGAADNLPTLPILIPGPLEGLLPNPCPENAQRLAGTLNIASLIGDVELEEQALFGEVTREFGESWEATLGARAYRIESVGAVTTGGVVYSSQNNFMKVTRVRGVSEEGISPKASIVFAPSDDLRTYVTASRGFRFGGPQIAASTPTSDVPEVYKSDSLWNYEVGLRTDWFDRSLRIDVSAYHIDWTDPQVFQLDRVATVNFIDNVGGAEGNGVELALRYLPPFLPGLSFDTALAWNRTVTTEPFESVEGGTVETGSPWPLSPRWQTATTLTYLQPVRDWQLGVSLRHLFLDEACNTIECTAQVFGYQTFDLNVFANPVGDSYWPQLSVSLNNLTDERGYSSITTNPLPANDTITYVAPRALVLRLSGSF